ncbi:FUSC family protein [Paraburkholderia sp. FT54]|nr:FUSC family protein [Paraburkholderia sp. FT54]WNC95133.1 FUSC family protein [Paraburkholderia sp. FT54]
MSVWVRATRIGAAAWIAGDGGVWLYLLKTATAALLALGIAMLLELSSPRTAMATVVVLMQPFGGMVLAKSFYRVVGTTLGMVAALMLGGIFAQQPELYMLGITVWIGACTAAALRYRHFQWYAFVLAGYTAALIGIPTVMEPGGLFMGAMTRAAEVTIGILCSSAVSALVLPLRSSTVLRNILRTRYTNFSVFAASVLAERVESDVYEGRFADLVDQIVGFEGARGFASFEDPNTRVRTRRLARLNSEFMNACTRLHALHQLSNRMRTGRARLVMEAVRPYFGELSGLLVSRKDPMKPDEARAARAAIELDRFRTTLPTRARETRRSLETAVPELLLDFDTTMELLYRFVEEFQRYTETYASLIDQKHVLERSVTRQVVKTNAYAVAFTFLRTVVAVGAVGAFWIATNWPSGGFAVIGAAVTCALTSTAPNTSKVAAQMAVGVAFATVVGYVFTCFVYPNIEGFPLLCAVLTPLLGLGAFLSMRPGAAGYGTAFGIFFCLLGGPDNVVVYTPDLIINNGIAVVAGMLVSCIVFAVIFPTQMSWRIEKIKRDLRRQMALACEGALVGLNQKFQSSTHDLMFQLRILLMKRSEQHRDTLRWMLVLLEVGNSVIDLRNETVDMPYAARLQPGWDTVLDSVSRDLADLFERPDTARLTRALASVEAAIRIAQFLLGELGENREKRDRMQRILSYLHFIRTALLDKDAPFYTTIK